MSGQGYEELIILNRKLDELFKRYNNQRDELTEIKKGNEVLKNMLQEREVKITELVREIDRCVALLNR
jgi:hypothetical protein